MANVIVKPFWFIFLILSTRWLGPQQFGTFMYSVSIIGIIHILFEFGIEVLTVKVISGKKTTTKRYINSAFALRIISFLLTTLLVFLLFWLTSLSTNRLIISILLIHTFSNSLLLFFRAIFRGYEDFRYEAASLIIERFLTIITCSIILFITTDLLYFVIGYSTSYLVSTIITYYLTTKKVFRLSPNFDFETLKSKVFLPGTAFAIMNILLVFRTRISSILIEWITGSETMVGFFNAGYRLVESYMLIPTIIIAPVFPVFARVYKRKKITQKIVLNSLRHISFITILGIVPLFIFRDQITLLLFGEMYENAADTIGILSLNMLFVGFTFVYGNLVSASGRQSQANRLIILESLIGFFAYGFFIKEFGHEGAAFVTLMMDGVVVSILLYLTWDLIGDKRHLFILLKIFIALLLSSLSTYCISTLNLNFTTSLIVSVILIFSILFSLKILTVFDFKRITTSFKKLLS